MSRHVNKRVVKDIEEVTEPTEVKDIEEIKEETLLVDDSTLSAEMLEDKEDEAGIEENVEEPIIEDTVEPITVEEEPKLEGKYNKNIDFKGRGFSSFEEAVKFIETSYFKGLGKDDKEEYLNWLKK